MHNIAKWRKKEGSWENGKRVRWLNEETTN